MAKFLKKATKIMAILLLLVVVIIASIATFVDPNDYKERINQLAQRYTDRSFEIKGSIQWSFTPELSLYLQDIRLGNLSGFESELLTAKEAHIQLDIWNLIKGNLVIDGVELQGLNITLERQADGRLNIDDIAQNIQADNSSSTNGQEQEHRTLQIAEISIKNSSVTYKDLQHKHNWLLKNLDLQAKKLELGPQGELPPITIAGQLQNLDFPDIKFAVNTRAQVNLTDQTINLKDLILEWQEARVQGETSVEKFKTKPIIAGKFALTPVSVNPLYASISKFLGLTKASNIKLPKELQARSYFKYDSTASKFELNELSVQLDEGTITGNLVASAAKSPTLTFDLQANELTVEEFAFIPQLFQTDATTGTQVQATNPTATNNTANPESYNFFSKAKVTGKINATNLIVKPSVILDTFNTEIQANNGLIKADPIKFNWRNNENKLALTVDTRNEANNIYLNGNIANLPVENISQEFGLSNNLSGIAMVNFKFNMLGNDVETIKKNINGNFDLTITNGTYKGTNLTETLILAEESLGELFALLNEDAKLSIPGIIGNNLQDWQQKRKAIKQTKFDSLTFTAKLHDSVSDSSSFTLDDRDFTVRGNGGFNLKTNSLRYKAEAKLHRHTAEQKQVNDYVSRTWLPVRISGTFDNIVVAPDVDKYLSGALVEMQKNLIQKATTKLIQEEIIDNLFENALEDIFRKK